MRLRNKTAIITGGNSGIGLATARLFVAEGARVAIIGRNQKTLDAAVAELGPQSFALKADVAEVPALEAAVIGAGARLGGLDILFANAGIPGATPLGQTTLEAFETIIRINLTGVFFTIQAALPHLRDGASIILNGSVHAVLGIPGSSAYAASKAGTRAMTRNLASELSPRRIRVNQVTPGATRTPIWDSRNPDPVAMAALDARMSAGIPLARMGEAIELAQAALFLASDESSYIQGSEIVVDGGATQNPWGAPLFRPA
jgi:NAD(P)-dependent dehydrogenase (short-subunit alcohol dehydrogenase family)